MRPGLTRERTTQAGFTLIELMISLTVLSIAIAAAFTMAFSLMNGYREHRGAVAVERTSRIVLDILASGVRASSPGMTSGQVWDECTGADIDTIQHINSSVASDELRVVHALGGALASLTSAQSLAGGTLTVDDNASFEADLWTPAVVIEPLTSKGHLVEVFASSADPTLIEVRPPGQCAIVDAGDQDYAAGSFVVRAVHMHYFVDPPFLMVDPDGPGDEEAQIMAEGIEDLQIAIGVEDGVDTGSLTETVLKTDDEWLHNAAADIAPDDTQNWVAPQALSDGAWRAMRITVVGIESREFREGGTNTRPAVEDRPAAVATDSFRRRAFSTTVELRNFANSE